MLINLGGVDFFRYAHEVYVLTPNQINLDEHDHSVFLLDSLKSHQNLEIFIGFSILTILILAMGLLLKSLPSFKKLGKFFDRASVFAPDFIRVVFGASLIFSGLHNSLFGPELPLSDFAGPDFLRILLFVVGGGLILGIATRLLGVVSLLIYLFAFANKGFYMLTYSNYLGEALAIILLPMQNFSIDALWLKLRDKKPKNTIFSMEAYSMPIARLLFGFSLLYTALYVKFFTPVLSLDVVNEYDLTRYFHFDPLMVVLGAGMVELLIAILYMLGLLQRLNTIVFVAFIISSLLFFKESVWPHYLLFGLAIGIFLHKPDRWTLDSKLFPSKKSKSVKH